MNMLFPERVVAKGARFSPCGQYRYSLWRIWDAALPKLGGLLLNPSTATAEEDDPTVYRMGQRARTEGFGGLYICNLFAWRSTDPDKIYRVPDPIGPENDQWIKHDMLLCTQVICGWGQHGVHMGRDLAVMSIFQQPFMPVAFYGKPYLAALKVNDDGTPSHPLYLPYTLKPTSYAGRVV